MSAQSNKSTSEEAKESNKLKTCPMCGNSGYILTEYHATDYTAHWVQCDCGAKGAECETNDNAIEHWNNRPEEDRLKARVKQCEHDALMADKHREKIIAQHDGLKARIEELEGLLEDANKIHHVDDWHEEDGDCLFFFLPLSEPPLITSPIVSNFKEVYTHFVKMPKVFTDNNEYDKQIKNWRAKK